MSRRDAFGRGGPVVATLGLAWALAGCQLEAPAAHNVALLYGITTYHSGIGGTFTVPDLQYPVADTQALEPLVSSASGGPFATVTVRNDAQATKSQLQADVATAAGLLDASSVFLFYYSGHGTNYQGHSYIVPHSTTGSNASYTVADFVSEDELRALLATLPTKKIVVILDSCNSGGFLAAGNGNTVPQDTEAYYRALWKAFLAGTAPGSWTELSSWYNDAVSGSASYAASWASAMGAGSGFAADQAQVLTAAGALELSYDDAGSGHGAFTNYLLKAKTAGDADGNGVVTVSEAYRYAFTQLQERWNGVWGAVAEGAIDDPVSGALAFLPHLSSGPVDFVLYQR